MYQKESEMLRKAIQLIKRESEKKREKSEDLQYENSKFLKREREKDRNQEKARKKRGFSIKKPAIFRDF